jgi:hypothetical protein
MQTHHHIDAEQGPTIFDRKVREVARRLDIPVAQVREVFAAYDAITMEWAHTEEEEEGSAAWTAPATGTHRGPHSASDRR